MSGDRELELQWSHVFSDMVRRKGVPKSAILVAASMEPCLFRHGKCRQHPIIIPGIRASMEPCLFRHGKSDTSSFLTSTATGFNGAMSFQTW